MRGAKRPGKLALLLGALTAFGPLSIDMYLPSFQAISRELAAGPAQVQLTLAVFFIALGIGQAFYGPVSDHYGRKRPLCFGLALYVLASAGCALAQSIEALIGWRFAQAIGGCAGMVIARAVVHLEVIATLLRFGWGYLAADARLCLAYLADDQQRAGVLLLVLGAFYAVAVTWRPMFGGVGVRARMV